MENNFKNILAYWTVKDKKAKPEPKNNVNTSSNNNNKSSDQTKSSENNDSKQIPSHSVLSESPDVKVINAYDPFLSSPNLSSSSVPPPKSSGYLNETAYQKQYSSSYFIDDSTNIIPGNDYNTTSYFSSAYSSSSSSYQMVDNNTDGYNLGSESYSSLGNYKSAGDSGYITTDTESYISEKSDDQKYLEGTRRQKTIGRDWNNEFQNLLRMPAGLEKFQKLSYLALDFVKAAENYGFIIIKEMFMPVELKTIKPIDIGGVAGGQKFMVQNILFKFAYDQEIQPGHYLYGGKYPSDKGASKAAGNELKGLSSFFQHALDNELANLINVPLMTIIDYYGYRLIAMSVLPITKQSLVYGSSDGGHTVHMEDPEVNQMMETLGKSMYLKGHLSGINAKFMYGPGDLEVHKSLEDSRYYCIDYGRLFPPEAHFDENDNAVPHREVFYKLLRPELLKHLDKPLSSDAFTGWSANDPDQDKLNQEVGVATKDLFTKVIPEAVQVFESEFKRFSSMPDYKKAYDIGVECHKFGINLRHLGRVRDLIKDTELRSLVLNEMIARIFKNKIKEILRMEMTGHYVGSEEKCIQTICDFLNKVFGINKYETDKDFWTIVIKTMFLEKYGHGSSGLSTQELDSKFDLLKIINLSVVISKFQTKTGIKLESRVKKLLADPNKLHRLPMVLSTDIKDVRPIIKHSNMIARSEGISLYMKATDLIYKNIVYYRKKCPVADYSQFKSDYSEETSLLDLCYQKLKLASRSSTTDSSLYHLIGLVDFERFKLLGSNPSLNNPFLLTAKEMFQTSIKYQETIGNMLSLATVFDIQGDYKSSDSLYKQILEKFPQDKVIPMIFESASCYSPTYGPIYNTHLNSVAFHQLIVIIDTLKPLPRDSDLVKVYLDSAYYLISILVLKCSISNDFQITKTTISVYTTRNNTNHSTNDSEIIYSNYVEESLNFNPAILNDFISFSFEVEKTYNIVQSLFTLCKYSPTLTKVLKNYLVDNQKILDRKDFYISLFSKIMNNPIQEIINRLNIPIEFHKLTPQNPDLAIRDCVKTLSIVYYPWTSSFLEQTRIFGPRITKLKLDKCTFKADECTVYDMKKLSFPNVKKLWMDGIDFPIFLFEALMNNVKDSLESLTVKYINCYSDNEESTAEKVNNAISQLHNLKKLKINSLKVNPNSIPTSIESINIEIDYGEESDHLMETISTFPNLKRITVTSNYNYAPLRQLSLEYLRIWTNSFKVDFTKIDNGIERWGKSLLHAEFHMPKDYLKFPEFISQLENLQTLKLEYTSLTDEMVDTMNSKLLNLKSLHINAQNYMLLESKIHSKSLENLYLHLCKAPIVNYTNIGLINPNLKSLTIDYPNRFDDIAVINLVEGLQSQLEKLTFMNCFDLTDNSLISLSQSNSKSTLSELTIEGSSKISDGSVVKLIDSCPQLKYIKSGMNFKQSATCYIRCKYPKLQFYR